MDKAGCLTILNSIKSMKQLLDKSIYSAEVLAKYLALETVSKNKLNKSIIFF